jgi:hypothetical protein
MKMRNFRLKSYSPTLVLALALMSAACGGNYSPGPLPNPPPPAEPNLTNMQGTWQLIFHSDVITSHYTVLEANLTQAGNSVFAGTASAIVYQATPIAAGSSVLKLTRLGSDCKSATGSNVSVEIIEQIQGSGKPTISLKLTDSGDLGSTVTTGAADTTGGNVSGGIYSTPEPCFIPEDDHGTFAGYQDSVRFSGETYSGTLNRGADVIVVQLASAATGFDLILSGTDNGAPFTLTGSTIGFSLELTGAIAGHATNWFGVYDPTYNTFLIYDSTGQLLGGLHPGPNAQSVMQVARTHR